MSTLGAFNASILGAFKSSTLGARGTGVAGPVASIIFDEVWQGTRTTTVLDDTFFDTITLFPFNAVTAPQVPGITGVDVFQRDRFDTVSIDNDYTVGITNWPSSIDVPTRVANYQAVGYDFTGSPFTESAFYALEPWGGLSRREYPIRPIGKAAPAYALAGFRTFKDAGGGVGAARRPNDANSDLNTSLRKMKIGLVGSPSINVPGTAFSPHIYLSHVFTAPDIDNGERTYFSESQRTNAPPDVTAAVGTIDIQGGPAAFPVTGMFRARIGLFLASPFVEPIVVFARKIDQAAVYYELFDMLEIDTTTAANAGYIDAGLVAGDDGGFAFRYQDTNLTGGLPGFDIYFNDTAKNADAKLGNSPAFFPNTWGALYNVP